MEWSMYELAAEVSFQEGWEKARRRQQWNRRKRRKKKRKKNFLRVSRIVAA